MTHTIDLNADLGEGAPHDAALMTVITSCNIACGGHAGNEDTMRAALTLAKTNGVACGAHPAFPDRENFGRTKSDLSGTALEAALRLQVAALKRLADEYGVALTHLKPHGALYNMAATDTALAHSILNVLQALLPTARLVGPPNSAMLSAAHARDVTYISEGFADRAYETDGSLRDRSKQGAMIHDVDAQVRQAVDIAAHGHVTTYTGQTIALAAKTLCVHGDTPDAFTAAKHIRSALDARGISVCPID